MLGYFIFCDYLVIYMPRINFLSCIARSVVFIRPFFMVLLCGSVLLVAGCGSNSAMESGKTVFKYTGNGDVSAEYLQTLPFASSLVRIDDGPSLLMTLSFADTQTHDVNEPFTSHTPVRLTWLAEGLGTIVTENGRIIRTTGFDFDHLEDLNPLASRVASYAGKHAAAFVPVENATNIKPSPKFVPLPGKQNPPPRFFLDRDRSNDVATYDSPAPWSASYDWSPDYRFDFTAEIVSDYLGEETVKTVLWQDRAQHFRETVQFTGIDSAVTNDFWVIPSTDARAPYVVKSIQYLGPKMTKIEMLMVKPFIESLNLVDAGKQAKKDRVASDSTSSIVMVSPSTKTADQNQEPLKLSTVLYETYSQLNYPVYALSTGLINPDKRDLVNEKKRVVVDQLRSLKRADADNIITQLNALYFVYFEPVVTDLDTLRLNGTLDIEINRRYWLSLPPKPKHIIAVSADRRNPSVLAQQPNTDLLHYLKQIPNAKDNTSVWVIQPDRKVYAVSEDEWLDKRVFLAPGATIFLGLKELPPLYKDLNLQIAQLLSHRLEPY